MEKRPDTELKKQEETETMQAEQAKEDKQAVQSAKHAAEYEEQDSTPAVPNTPEKKNPVKHIVGIETTPFRIAHARRTERTEKRKESIEDTKHSAEEQKENSMRIEQSSGIENSMIVEERGLEEEEIWFRKKRAGRKKKAQKLDTNTARAVTKSSHAVCPVEGYFETHYTVKGVISTNSSSIVYAVEEKRESMWLPDREQSVCTFCALKTQAEAEAQGRAKEAVVKIARKKWMTDKERTDRVREAKFLYRLRNKKHIVQLVRAWEEKGLLYIQTQMCTEGTLKEYTKTHRSTEEKVNIVVQMLKGLKAIHSKKIIHMDIKPENIYIHKDRNTRVVVQIGDFGISRAAEDSKEIEYDGDRLYMAPEVLRNVCSYASDVYSMGLVIAEVASETEQQRGTAADITQWTKKQSAERTPDILSTVREIAKRMTHMRAGRRPSISDVLKKIEGK